MHGYENEVLQGKRTDTRGRRRGLVISPDEIFELLRDTYTNIPIPGDAQFQALQIDDANRRINFYYSTNTPDKLLVAKESDNYFNPLGHCVTFLPQTLVNILKYWFDGKVPSDAEFKAFHVHKLFNFLCLEVASDKFPDSMSATLPMLHLRYEGGRLMSLDEKGATVTSDVN